jgi:hypothetical protein
MSKKTKKINPNTNIFNSVINAVQTFKRIVYVTSQCSAKYHVQNKTMTDYITARSRQGCSLPFFFDTEIKKVIFSFFVKYGIKKGCESIM